MHSSSVTSIQTARSTLTSSRRHAWASRGASLRSPSVLTSPRPCTAARCTTMSRSRTRSTRRRSRGSATAAAGRVFCSRGCASSRTRRSQRLCRWSGAIDRSMATCGHFVRHLYIFLTRSLSSHVHHNLATSPGIRPYAFIPHRTLAPYHPTHLSPAYHTLAPHSPSRLVSSPFVFLPLACAYLPHLAALGSVSFSAHTYIPVV